MGIHCSRNQFFFSVFSSAELKAKVSFSAQNLSVVCCCFIIFSLFCLLQNLWAYLDCKIGTKHPDGDSNYYKKEPFNSQKGNYDFYFLAINVM